MIIDSHVHFNTKLEYPYEDLRKKLSSAGIDKCVLIINSIDEFRVLCSKISPILSDRIVCALGAILDPHEVNPLHIINICKELGLPIAIKLHPRMSSITQSDFRELAILIKRSEIDTIIIDSFVYGPQIESHIGCELALFLAESFKEKRIVLAHAGGCDILKTLLITRPVRNIYYDFSLSCNYLLGTSVEKDMIHGIKYWGNRIMFGSDYPDFDFVESLRVNKLLCESAGISQSAQDAYFNQNAVKVFGIRNEV